MKRVRWSRHTKIYLSLGVLLLSAATAATLYDPALNGLEARIFYWFYNSPDALRLPVLVITQGGSIWVLLGLVVGAVLSNRYNIARRLAYSGLSVYVSAVMLKYLIGHPRPAFLLDNVAERESILRSPGFPSAHAALATIVGLTLMPYLPKRLRWLVPVGIVCVAVSRLYLGVHSPWDVVGGVGVGLIGAAVSSYIFDGKLAKSTRKA